MIGYLPPAPEVRCGSAGGRVWVVIGAAGIEIREPGDDEALEGPLPAYRDGSFEYDDEGVSVALAETSPSEGGASNVHMTITAGDATTIVDCVAPEGVPACSVE